MLARAHTFTIDGLQARHVAVEVDVRRGLPAFTIVGLADTAVREGLAPYLWRSLGPTDVAWLAGVLGRERARVVHLHTFGSQVIGTQGLPGLGQRRGRTASLGGHHYSVAMRTAARGLQGLT